MSTEIPQRLAQVRDFVNTYETEDDTDALRDAQALAAWLADRDLLQPDDGVAVTADDLDWAIAVREALRAALEANHDRLPPPAEARAVLDDAADRAHLTLRFTRDGGVRLTPLEHGVTGAIGHLLAIMGDAVREGSWTRLKACSEAGCRWAFYDNSRNHSGKWCSMAACGNRAKVRAFRERRQGA